MREIRASFPLMAAIALTRGLAGVGLGLLLAGKVRKCDRAKVGGALLGIGALSTIPIAIDLFRKMRTDHQPSTIANVPQSGADGVNEEWMAD